MGVFSKISKECSLISEYAQKLCQLFIEVGCKNIFIEYQDPTATPNISAVYVKEFGTENVLAALNFDYTASNISFEVLVTPAYAAKIRNRGLLGELQNVRITN